MRILLFGASGGCGSWVVRLAQERNHEITAVIRPETKFNPPFGVDLVKGNVLDDQFVKAVLEGHPLVISCLGQRRAGLHPWARLQSPPDLVERVMRNLANGTREPKPQVLWISAGGVGSSRKQSSFLIKKMIRMGNVGTAYRDLAAAEEVMDSSGLDYLAVRPVTLTHGPPTFRAGPVRHYGLFSTIRRSDVAAWMVQAAEGAGIEFGNNVLLGAGTPTPHV